jgi:anti-sigma factor RsiW
MHGPIRDRLEELLNPDARQEEIARQLASHPDCAAEFDAMRQQSALLRCLRAPAEAEPDPGFYARVVQRIEESGVRSIWSVFTEGPFGTWLAYASLALALLIGAWLVGTERADGHFGHSQPVIARQSPSEMQVSGDQAHQRDVVLVNLATYSDQSQ